MCDYFRQIEQKKDVNVRHFVRKLNFKSSFQEELILLFLFYELYINSFQFVLTNGHENYRK